MSSVKDMNSKIGEHDINVRVITTSGSYPAHGHEKAPLAEEIAVILARAASALGIVDTSQWVARIDGTDVDPHRTYADLGYHGEVKIDFGRREGGGGAHAPEIG
jgi:hypothetical protein